MGQSVCQPVKVREFMGEMDSAHSPQHFSPSNSSSLPGSHFGLGVMLPSKHGENLGLNDDFSHPEALKSNRFLHALRSMFTL